METLQTIIREDDLLVHIEDTRLFWVTRDGEAVKLAWNELTEDERRLQHEADCRARYCVMFDIY